MDSKNFGALALQLLQSAMIPGSALDEATEFRQIAEAIVRGDLQVCPRVEESELKEVSSNEGR